MTDTEQPKPRTFTEHLDIAGGDLIDRIKALLADSRAKLIRIREADGDVFLEIPLTYGAIAGGAVALAAPWLAVLGTLAGVAARVRVEIVREGDGPDAERPQSGA